MKTPADCDCGEDHDKRAMHFVCRGCKKSVCGTHEGCDDDMLMYCDDCWAKAHLCEGLP